MPKPRRTAVCDASPLIILAKAGLLELFDVLKKPILVPRSVADEIFAKSSDLPATRALQLEGLFSIVEDPPVHDLLLEKRLGAGETAVIALCQSEKERVALIDDQAARRCAEEFDIPVAGTAGLVIAACRLGLVDDIRAVLRQLVESGLYLSKPLIREIVELSESD